MVTMLVIPEVYDFNMYIILVGRGERSAYFISHHNSEFKSVKLRLNFKINWLINDDF